MLLAAGIHFLFLLPRFQFVLLAPVEYNGIGKSHTTIPNDIPTNVERCYLEYNKLTTVGSGAFSAYSSLKTLRLYKNQISSIAPDAFVNTNIQFLILNHNLMSDIPDLLGIEGSLITLDLANNPLNSVPVGSFIGFSKLKHLKFTACGLSSFPDVTEVGDTLKSLTLNDNDITHIPSSLLNLEKLETLAVARNNIATFPDLSHVEGSLKSLQINNNPVGTIPPDGVSNSGKLQLLQLTSCGLVSPPELSQTNSRLKTLTLNYNSIGNLPSGYFTYLASLQKLLLNRCGLTLFPDLSGLGSNLKTLFMCHNHIKSIPKDALAGLSGLQELNMTGNLLTAIPDIRGLGLSIDYFGIRDNPLDCSCHALTWINDVTYFDMSAQPCFAPASLIGVLWNETTERQLMEGCWVMEGGSKRLTGHRQTEGILANHTCRGVIQCAQSCLANPRCGAVNTKSTGDPLNRKFCELVDAGSVQDSLSLVPDITFDYYVFGMYDYQENLG